MRAATDKRFGPRECTPGVIKSPKPIAETALIQAQAAFSMGADLRGITILASALVAIQTARHGAYQRCWVREFRGGRKNEHRTDWRHRTCTRSASRDTADSLAPWKGIDPRAGQAVHCADHPRRSGFL